MLARVVVALTLLAAAPASAEGISGVWTGYYYCGPELASLTMRIEQSGDDTLSGLFDFGPHPEARLRVPDGSFALRGAVDPGNGFVTVRLDDWIRRPPGYATVELTGVHDPGADAIEGRVVGGQNCSCFRVERVPASPAPNDDCEGEQPEAKPVPRKKPPEVERPRP